MTVGQIYLNTPIELQQKYNRSMEEIVNMRVKLLRENKYKIISIYYLSNEEVIIDYKIK